MPESSQRDSNSLPLMAEAPFTAKDGDLFSRALVHPDKNDFAPRCLQLVSLSSGWFCEAATDSFYQHAVRIGSESMLALNPPFVIDGSLTQRLWEARRRSSSCATDSRSSIPFILI